MDVPTAEEAKDLSPLLAETFPESADDEALQMWLDVMGRLVASLTCRIIGDVTGDGFEEVPDDLVPLAERTIIMKTEAFTEHNATTKSRRKRIRNANLQSISAGPWSESYFGPDEAIKAKQLDPDPDLAGLLWALATQACRDAWLALWTGEHAPAAAAMPYEYSRRPGGALTYGSMEYL